MGCCFSKLISEYRENTLIAIDNEIERLKSLRIIKSLIILDLFDQRMGQNNDYLTEKN